MNDLNTSQVKLTNDASTVSKHSAVSKCYFIDEFIEEFVEKKKTRASLIHLGYYTRAVTINKLIIDFIEYINLQKFTKFQIISCGSGFDTTYWKLSKANLLNKSLFIEIDFSDVVQRKIYLIRKSKKLQFYCPDFKGKQIFPGINKMNFNYFILETDLSDLNSVEKLFKEVGVDYNTPTLFLSECVVTYMKESDSSGLIKWMAEKFKNGGFVNYEQIHPDDGFGQVMLKHFEKLQSSLFSVKKYPDCESHHVRYKNLGFQSSFCLSEWDAFIWLTTIDERKRVFSLELFDEFEEFHLKCVHYVVALAGNGISSCWINGFIPVSSTRNDLFKRVNVKVERLKCDLELFRHFSCFANKSIFIFGGCCKQKRSSKVYKIELGRDFLDVKELNNLEHSDIKLDMVLGTAITFEINNVQFVCLYGGRTSPNKVWNDGSPLLLELIDNKFSPKLVINKGNAIPRYRSSMVCCKRDKTEASCWIFGGRTADLNQSLCDFWELKIKFDDGNNITFNWRAHEKKNENWPCGRMSHSLTMWCERFELFLIGGLTVDLSSVLNDIWKWCCRSKLWEKVNLAGNLLPRYGHTANLKDGKIYLVGGVNTLEGMQPGLGVIDLKNLTATEFAISLTFPEPVLLFNHTSELLGEGDDTSICIFGGGGNCFSFGTYLNQFALSIKISQLR